MLKVVGTSMFKRNDITIYKNIELNKSIKLDISIEDVNRASDYSLEIFQCYVYGELLSFEVQDNIIDKSSPKVNLLILINMRVLYKTLEDDRLKISISSIPVYFSLPLKSEENKEKVLEYIKNNEVESYFKIERVTIEKEDLFNISCTINCSVGFKDLESQVIPLKIKQESMDRNLFLLNTLTGELEQITFSINNEYSFIEEIKDNRLICLKNDGLSQIPYIIDTKSKLQEEYNIRLPIKTFGFLEKLNDDEFFTTAFVKNKFVLYHLYKGNFTKLDEDIICIEGLNPILNKNTNTLYYCKYIDKAITIFSLNLLNKEISEFLKFKHLIDLKIAKLGTFILAKVKNKANTAMLLINIIRGTKIILEPPNYKSVFVEGYFLEDSTSLLLILEENFVCNIYLYNIEKNELIKISDYKEKCKIRNIKVLNIEDSFLFSLNSLDGQGVNIYKYNFINKEITKLSNTNCKSLEFF